ncbi:MAG: TIGR01212 family radical SAM protein [Thermodesulfobacteriota bacterium]|nr:TIGR01212 family radical SAM protein [Thermodesulfobacteriota bacterium]
MIKRRYSDYNAYLKSIYGERVQKITVDAGLGCPNRDGTLSRGGCIYCNSLGSGSGLFAKGMSITEQIENGRKAMIRRYKAKKFLVYFQSFTNTYTSCENMKKMYDEALLAEGIMGLAIGTRPDCVDAEKLDLIESYAKKYLIWIEYGLQSVHDSTLKLINRGHDFKAFKNAVEMTKNRGINICVHVILGLPNETREMMLKTARVLGELGIDGVKLHLLYVVKGTALEEMWKKGEYKCMEQKEYVETLCDFLELLPENVIIQRITGDPHLEELAAPQWANQRNETFHMIQNTMEQRDSRQGINN